MITALQKLVAYLGPTWAAVGGTATLLVIASTIANRFRDPDHDPATPPPLWVQIVDVLSLLAARGQTGLIGPVSLPGFPSRQCKPSAPARLPLPAIAFLLLPTLLAGCAFGQCILGKLPSSAQPILIDATEALSGNDWEAALAKISAVVGADALDCAVVAIVDARQKRAAEIAAHQVDPAVRMAPIDLVLEHGRAYLAKRPTHACAPRGAA